MRRLKRNVPRSRRLVLALAAAAATAAIGGSARGDSYDWQGPSTGLDWYTPNEWYDTANGTYAPPTGGSTAFVGQGIIGFAGNYAPSPLAYLLVDYNFGSNSNTPEIFQIGGTMSADQEFVGEYTRGTYEQDGGTNDANSAFTLGYGAGSIGNYILGNPFVVESGTLAVGGLESIGASGTGNFSQGPGTTNTAADSFVLGVSSGSSGTYTMAGGMLNSPYEAIGYAGTGIINQSAGINTLTSGGQLAIGQSSGAGSEYNLSGTGVVNVGSTADVGGYAGTAGGTGALNISGGTMNVVGLLTVYSAAGQVNLSGGTLNVGSLSTKGNPNNFLGNGSTTGWTGGTLGITGANGFTVGSAGPLGSNLTLSTGLTLIVSNTLTNSGTLTISGGALIAGALAGNPINWVSGTLALPTLTSDLTVGPNQIFGAAGVATSIPSGVSLNVVSGGVVGGELDVGGHVAASGTAVFKGPVDISSGGSVKSTGASATFNGVINNGGSYTSDPSVNIFTNSVTNTPSGAMTGGAGDQYFMSGGSFENDGTFTNGGLLQSSDPVLNTGTFTQTGTFDQSASFTNTGTATIGGIATISSLSGSGSLTVQTASRLTLPKSNGANAQGSLTIQGTGTLDITDNALAINDTGPGSTPISTIAGYIASGFNGNAWNGSGIVSSEVASVNAMLNDPYAYAVAYANASDAAVVNDHFTPGTVVIKPAIVGDANLDGVVNYTDFQLLSGSFNGVGTSWDQGNFNYGAGTSYTDFQLLSGNFNDSTSLDAGEFDSMNAIALSHGQELVANADGYGFSLVTVPEPATVGILGFASLGLLVRRKRRNGNRQTRPAARKSRVTFSPLL